MNRIRRVVAANIGKIAYVTAVCGCWVTLAAFGQTEVLPYVLSFIAPYFAMGLFVMFVDLFL